MNIDINKFSGVELISALQNSENELIELMLHKGILFNLSSPKTNPLFIAVRKGNSEAVRMILDKGIDATLEYSNEFMKSFSAIQLAQNMKQNEIVAILEAYQSRK
jgi:ankyrin repeat protein